MKQDSVSVDEQYDQKSLEYYSLLRGFFEQAELAYWIGNPSVQIINGTMKLKPMGSIDSHYDTIEEYIHAIRQTLEEDQQDETEHNKEAYVLLLNGIPNSKGPSELLYDSPLSRYSNQITEVRVIRTSQLRYYAVLLLFASRKQGRQCFKDLSGRQYNQVQFEKLALRQVQEVTFSYSEPQRGSGELVLRKLSQVESERRSPDHIFLSSGHLQTIGIKGEEKNTCTICLEQLGGQIISILCGHYFHRHCLQKWQFNTCPLCRYYQQPPLITFCEQCNQSDGLWLCLLCGRRLCCGTVNDIMSQDSHIYQHCKETGHALSMELQTKFLFDARVPAFLHQMFYRQLIQKGEKSERIEEGKQSSKKSKMSERISNYESEVAEEMQKQRAYFEQNLYKIIKNNRNLLNSRKEKLQIKKKQLQSLNCQEEELIRNNQQLGQQIAKTEKEELIISNLIKIKQQKAQLYRAQADKRREMQRKRVAELEALIQQKKTDLLNYKNNIVLQQQLKAKLKGEQVGNEIMLMHEKNKKKKR